MFTYSDWLHRLLSACSHAIFVGFIQIAITTIANLSSCTEDSGKFFDVDQVCADESDDSYECRNIPALLMRYSHVIQWYHDNSILIMKS